MAYEEQFKEINNKIDRISEDMTDVKVILARQEENISHHIKRTDLLEENVELLRDEMRKDLSPIKRHVQTVNNLLLFIGAAGGIILFLNELGILKKLGIFQYG